jgi:hypothetical protein
LSSCDFEAGYHKRGRAKEPASIIHKKTNMKALRLIVLICLTLPFCFFLSNCGPDEIPQEELDKREILLKLTSGVWRVSQVAAGAVDISRAFANTTITFTETQIEVSNPLAPITTTEFELMQDSAGNFNELHTSTGLVYRIEDLTDTRLRITFSYAATGGRTQGLSNTFDVILIK